MAIAYKSAGSGVSTETSGAALSPACPATVDAGDILIAHVFWEGTTTAPSTPSGWTLLSGPHVIETTIARHWVFGKVADGTEDGATAAFGSPAVTTQRAARIYSFSGRVSGDISLLCQGFSHQSHATDPQMPTVTTVRAGALAVALVAQNDNNATGNATGESGGDWTEAVAEYTVALTPGLTIQLQTCTPTSNPGTVSGGSVSTTNDPCGVIGFYIQDVAETPKTATESVAVGITDAQPSTLASIIANDSLLGFVDDWRLLTDSDTFTNHNRTDELTVKLTGATGGGGTTPVSATDSLPAGMTDTSVIFSTISVTDSLSAGLTDAFTGAQAFSVTDSLAVQASESSVITSIVTVTDSLSIGLTDAATQLAAVLTAVDSLAVQGTDGVNAASVSAVASDSIASGLTDTFTGSQAVSVTDSLAGIASEATAISSSISCSDSLNAGLTDTITQVAAVLAATDSTSVQAGDAVNQVTVAMTAAESLQAGLTDTFTGSHALSTADSLTTQFSEAAFLAVSAFANDSLIIQFTDLGTLSQTTISASESLTVGLSEVANVIQNSLVSVSDNCVTGLSESATINQAFTVSDSVGVGCSDLFTGSQALGVSDDLGLPLSEDQSSSLLTVASDGVATSLSGAASVFLSFESADALAVLFSDLGSKQDVEAAIPKSAADSCGVAIEEGAVTEIVGPYWGGSIGEEHALAYADSYIMGRRENPGKARW